MEHLFWSCPFASDCWGYICPQRRRDLQILDAFEDNKSKLGVPFDMEIIMLTTWGIWIVRNNKIFSSTTTSFQSWKALYFQELRMVSHRMKKKYASSFKEWLQSRV
jgi:hypothetical protein